MTVAIRWDFLKLSAINISAGIWGVSLPKNLYFIHTFHVYELYYKSENKIYSEMRNH